MPRYHVNPTTGSAGKCTATVSCPFGDINTDHYDSAKEARAGYERQMGSGVVKSPVTSKPSARAAFQARSPIMLPPTKLDLPQDYSATYSIDYDYDSYECSGSTCSYSDEGEYMSDMCRDREYTGLRATGWDNPDGIYGYARATLNLPPGPLPSSLESDLKPYEDFETIADDFDIRGEGDYYGDSVAADMPPYITKALKDYYYSQPDAMDKNKVLPYLRGKGYDTTGQAPLDALKDALQLEAGGKLPTYVMKAKAFKVSSISLKNIDKPDGKREAAAKADPKPLKPVKGVGQNAGIAGVVFRKDDGRYELIDGYGRTAELESSGKRRNGNYIVLRSDPPADANRNYYYNRNLDLTWCSE